MGSLELETGEYTDREIDRNEGENSNTENSNKDGKDSLGEIALSKVIYNILENSKTYGEEESSGTFNVKENKKAEIRNVASSQYSNKNYYKPNKSVFGATLDVDSLKLPKMLVTSPEKILDDITFLQQFRK